MMIESDLYVCALRIPSTTKQVNTLLPPLLTVRSFVLFAATPRRPAARTSPTSCNQFDTGTRRGFELHPMHVCSQCHSYLLNVRNCFAVCKKPAIMVSAPNHALEHTAHSRATVSLLPLHNAHLERCSRVCARGRPLLVPDVAQLYAQPTGSKPPTPKHLRPACRPPLLTFCVRALRLADDFHYDKTHNVRPKRNIRMAMQHGALPSTHTTWPAASVELPPPSDNVFWMCRSRRGLHVRN